MQFSSGDCAISPNSVVMQQIPLSFRKRIAGASGGAQYPAAGNIPRHNGPYARHTFVLTPYNFGKIVEKQRHQKRRA
jgi:hypothetical protein